MANSNLRKKCIVVLGSSNTDMVVRLARIPRPGETILGGDFMMAAGGKGANQAVAAARSGGKVTFVAKVGRDTFGREAVRGWVRDTIDCRYVFQDPLHPSGVALIFVAKSGENSIAVASGANSCLSCTDLKKARRVIVSSSVVLLQLETPLKTVMEASRMAVVGGARVILNPAPAQPLPDELLRNVSIITPNETEAELLTGIKISKKVDAAKAARILLYKGVQTVVITLGAKGAWVADSTGSGKLIPSFKMKAVDTTAAGDTFNGALAVALAENQPLYSAVRFANAAAAISVTRAGAQPSAPARKEILKLLRSS
jgi:ribokinase